jgi:taurine dioxygenase
METEPLTGHIGAELRGVDLRDLDDDAFGAVHRAFLEHQVVLLPGQFLNPAELLAFARRFGEIFPNPLSPKAAGQPEVTELVTRDGGAPDRFHFDTSYVDVPPKISVLSMVRSPPVGGDTLWASGYAIHDSFSPPMRAFLEQLHVHYDPRSAADPHAADHPLVAVHTETGRAALLLDTMWCRRVVELERPESEALLAFLKGYVTDPTFSCRYRWSDGTVAMWDNRCTLHRVASDFVGERIIHRVTVAGDAPRP